MTSRTFQQAVKELLTAIVKERNNYGGIRMHDVLR